VKEENGLNMRCSRFVVLLIVLLSTGTCTSARAQDSGFGIGLMLGEPTGISGKQWISSRNAIDGGLAWSFRQSGFFHLHADYLWHFFDVIRSEERFVPYGGLGGRLGATRGDALLGVRFVGGLLFLPRTVPLDVFVELAPVFDLAPATRVDGNGGIGVRFYLK
jgi:hypothetical protein